MFNEHAAGALKVERTLHECFFKDFGLSPEAVAATPLAPDEPRLHRATCSRSPTARPFHEAVAALLPCYWIYWEVGKTLERAGSPDPLYARWIGTYASEEFGARRARRARVHRHASPTRPARPPSARPCGATSSRPAATSGCSGTWAGARRPGPSEEQSLLSPSPLRGEGRVRGRPPGVRRHAILTPASLDSDPTRRRDMAQDLPGYLDLIKRSKPDDLVIVSKEVDPAYEITALVVKLEREAQAPAGADLRARARARSFPVLTNLHASRSRLAARHGLRRPRTMLATYLRAMDKPIPPRVVASGPVQGRGARPATASISTTCRRSSTTRATRAPISPPPSRSPRTRRSETWNCAYNRLMIKGRDTTSIHLTRGQAPLGVPADRRGARRAAARGLRHRRAPGHRARRARHRLDRRGRARHHGRAARRAARAGEVRDLRRAGARARRDDHRGARSCRARARPRAPSASSPATAWASASARWCRSRPSPTARAPYFQDITVAHLDHMLLSTIPMEANLYRAVRAMVPSVKAVRVPGPVHLLRLDRAAAARPGQERDPRRARRRPLHEARGRGGPGRGHLRRPPGDLGHRHALPARPRHHRSSPTRAARTSIPRPARTATPPSGAWTRPPSPRSPPTRRATACRPRCGSASNLKDYVE